MPIATSEGSRAFTCRPSWRPGGWSQHRRAKFESRPDGCSFWHHPFIHRSSAAPILLGCCDRYQKQPVGWHHLDDRGGLL